VSRRYFAIAVAKVLAERLGDHVGKFPELVDKTDPAEIIALLRSRVQAAVSEGTSGSGGACRGRCGDRYRARPRRAGPAILLLSGQVGSGLSAL
jgi:hypothetical protein